MNEHYTTSDLKQRVASSCRSFLKEAIEIAASSFGSTELPTHIIHSQVMEPSGPGSHSGKEMVYSELNMYEIWNRIDSTVKDSGAWTKAKDSVQLYIDVHNIKPTGFWPHDLESQYLVPLLRTYLEDMGAFAYNHQRVRKAINAMLRHLDSREVEVVGLIVLEGFEAVRSFCLEPKLLVHPIEERELLTLGRTDTMLGPGLGRGEHLPQTDWWICEVRLANPRGTAIGWNRIHDFTDILALALRAFKPGGVALGLATIQFASPFGRMGQMRGGRLQRIAVGESHYTLSSKEIPKFIKFWRKLRHLMEEPQHYLQVPIRRLRAAGTRAQGEDTLVDYVIGLEALLGKEDERAELGYRFRVRGSVLLASKRKERKMRLRELRDLYDLRSRIVHGQAVSAEKLKQALPLAEGALRRVWNWYFTRWYAESSNEAGIEQIDEDLVIR